MGPMLALRCIILLFIFYSAKLYAWEKVRPPGKMGHHDRDDDSH